MTKHDRSTSPLPGEAQATERIPIALSPARERQILARVREAVLDQQPGYQSTPAQRPANAARWAWATGGSFALAACAALLWWTGWLASNPQLRYQNLQLTQTKYIEQDKPAVEILQTPKGKQGSVALAQRWQIDTFSETRISVYKGSRQTQQIELHQGLVKIHVRPHTMKRFAVQMKGYRVEVKGTRFDVERSNVWLRVEVWRGKVVLHTPQAKQQGIALGQGCRVDLKRQTLHCYPLPPHTHRVWHKRIQWLGQHHPETLLAYATDMASNPRWPLAKRASLLRSTTEALYKARQWRATIEGYRLLSQLQVADSNQALVDAALLCRKTLHNNPRLCQDIFQQCLRQCKDATWREQSLAMLAMAQYQQTRATQSIHRYLARYPTGTWQTNLRRLLVRQAISQGQPCRQARQLLAPGDRGEPWFIQRCSR